MLQYIILAIISVSFWLLLRSRTPKNDKLSEYKPIEPAHTTPKDKTSISQSQEPTSAGLALTDDINEKEKENIDKRIRVAEQTKKSFEKKGKGSIIAKAGGKLVPPGQRLTKKWVVLDLGLRPKNFALENWSLKLVETKTQKEETLTLDQIKAFGAKSFKSDFHCYTGWTIQDLYLTGVPFKRIIEHFAPSASWKYLLQIGADGYTTNSPRTEWERDDIFLGWEIDGKPIPEDHGVIRLFNQSLYGSKSSKFLSEIHFLEEDHKGFWELRGVHERGNVFLEERYSQRKREKVGVAEAERIIAECKENVSVELDLSGLELTEIPASVYSLTQLRSLLLFNNAITTIPDEAAALSKLTTLSLNSNKLTEIPPVISKLNKLSELWMCDNLVTKLPEHLIKAKNLFVLGIESNLLTDIPDWICQVPQLGALFCDRNKVQKLPREIGDRPWQALLFSENPIEFIPKEIGQLDDITFLGFFGVPCLPQSVLEEGTQGILKYLKDQGDAKVHSTNTTTSTTPITNTNL